MKIVFISLFTVLALSVNASETDREIFEKIVGKWSITLINGDLISSETTEYKNNGEMIARGNVTIHDESIIEYTIKFAWVVRDGRSNMEIIESTNTDLFPIGQKVVNRITSVDEEKLVYQNKVGRQYKFIRLGN